jgi:predicted nucleotidyltransferase/uncharacterized protein (UPF0332 family)
MKFKIEKKHHSNISKYRQADLKVANAFSQEVIKELKDYIKAIILFGSTVEADKPIIPGETDIDILIIVDDLSIRITPEFIEAYRIIVEKIAIKHSKRLHISTLKFTNFWEYMRVGDPIGLNMLRSGLPLYDLGFFEPIQALLKSGKIRPSQESVWTYFAKAPSTLQNSRWHLLQATLDLYWGVIDSAHAALMAVGEMPPSPAHVADLLDKALAKKRLIKKKYVETMEKFYKLSKMIVHRQIQEIKGEQYELYYKEAEEFIEEMRQLIEKKL